MENGFWERVSIQQVTEFFLHNTELVEADPGTYPERQAKNDKDFIRSLHEYRKRILEADWKGLTGDALIGQDEDIYTDCNVTHYYQDAINLAFEMGLIAGHKLKTEIDNAAKDILA